MYQAIHGYFFLKFASHDTLNNCLTYAVVQHLPCTRGISIIVFVCQATADACLLAATRAARSLYAARMEERVRGERSVPASALAAAHAAARADAERCYAQKKKLGSQQDADTRLEELLKV